MEHRHVAILGNGSWATALAKIVMQNEPLVNWYIRREEVIEQFAKRGKNPDYLTNVQFDPKRIQFSSDINEVIHNSDILVLAIPSPYVKPSLQAINCSLAEKTIITATKGMIPDENQIVTDYLHERFNMP